LAACSRSLALATARSFLVRASRALAASSFAWARSTACAAAERSCSTRRGRPWSSPVALEPVAGE
jgi:hypothetical protein